MGSTSAHTATDPPPSPQSGLAVTSVRIERSRLAAFKRVAEANRRSVSQELRWLIDRHIEAAEEASAA